MNATEPIKKTSRAAMSSFAMVLLIWSVFLSCWCGPTCAQAKPIEQAAVASETAHGCCAPPVEEVPADDCCDANGYDCCDYEVAELAPVETSPTVDIQTAATLVDLPALLPPAKPVVRTLAPRVLEVTHHGPPQYLRFEILLI